MRKITLTALVVIAAVVAALGQGREGGGRQGRYPAATGGDIVITPVLHASVQVEYRDTVVHVDPWSTADLAPLKKASLILVTDDPAHHLDPKAITSLRRPGAPEHPKGEASGYLITLGDAGEENATASPSASPSCWRSRISTWPSCR